MVAHPGAAASRHYPVVISAQTRAGIDRLLIMAWHDSCPSQRRELRGGNMRIGVQKFSVLLVAFAVVLAAATVASAQPTLVVSPAVISNTYSGVITLNINGLTNGEQVIVQRYLDLNGNGVVDLGEPLIDLFKIKDGGAQVIGGITNLNVPYDTNPTNGAITTTLNF